MGKGFEIQIGEEVGLEFVPGESGDHSGVVGAVFFG